MNIVKLIFIIFTLINFCCECYKILGIFPGNGRSHHILFSSLMEELASRNHDVTVINYLPTNRMPNLRQISLMKKDDECTVNMTHNLNTIPSSAFVDFYRAYDMAILFKEMANDNCNRLVTNDEIKGLINSKETFDVVIVEQFVTDCGLAIAHKLNAPTIGIAAHMLMPWTYSRLGAPNNPAFVPNHLCATGTRPSFLNKIKSGIINVAMTAYYNHIIQKTDQMIVNNVYPEVPDFESLGRNLSLIMVNQYFSLTGSRLQGANVIEIGGFHVTKHSVPINDMELISFLDNAKEGVIYISFGTVASNFPINLISEIVSFIESSKFKFVWKVDIDTIKIETANVILRKWLPQPSVLCHPNVIAFVSHSGMLSTSEAIHCGVPMVSVPLFGDQFSNSAAAVEKGLAVALDIYSLDRNALQEALNTVLQERYRARAKQLSKIWRDRPMSPMDTAVFWVEYVARNKGLVDMKPSSVHLNVFEYFGLDLIILISLIFFMIFKVFSPVTKTKKTNSKQKLKKK